MGKWLFMGHRRWAGLCSAIAWVRRFVRLRGSSRPKATTVCAGRGTNLHPLLHRAARGGLYLLPIPRWWHFNVSLVHGKWLFPFAPSRRLAQESGGDEREVITTRRRSAAGPHVCSAGGCQSKHRSRGVCVGKHLVGASRWVRGLMGFLPGNGKGRREGGDFSSGGYSRAWQVSVG